MDDKKELWELLEILSELEGVECSRLVGGKLRTSLPCAWHIKAAKSLNKLNTEDVADLLDSLIPPPSSFGWGYSARCSASFRI